MKAKFIKLIKVLGTFFASYLLILELYWRVIEPTTYFNAELLKQCLGVYWWLVIYGSPLLIALPLSIVTYYKATHKKYLDEFNRQTQQIIEKAQIKITPTGMTFEKKEVSITENQLLLGRPVLITGEAGTGKSGVGVFLAQSSTNSHKSTLIIDARQMQHLHDEQALREFYHCEEPLEQAVGKIGANRGFRLIIDQLDNIAGKQVAKLLIDLAVKCSTLPGVQVVVISRKRESYEAKLLHNLLQNNFVEIECRLLDELEVQGELKKLGFQNPGRELVKMSQNLLNFEILSKIKSQNPAFTFNEVEDEVTLWDAYFETLQDRESVESNLEDGEQTLSQAMNLAKEVLASGNQEFLLSKPLSLAQRRLVSWDVVVHNEGMRYRFRHEKLQDYLYARYAAERGHLPNDVLNEIGAVKSRNAFVWLAKIYMHKKSPLQIQFLEALLNG